MKSEEDRIKELELYAWVGEDDLGGPGSEIGLKQALTQAGYIPLVATKMAAQSAMCGKTIRLVRFTFAEVVDTIKPKSSVGKN